MNCPLEKDGYGPGWYSELTLKLKLTKPANTVVAHNRRLLSAHNKRK